MPAPATASDEATPLLSQSPPDGSESVAQITAARGSQDLDGRTKRILLSVFVANFLIAFGHYVAIASIVDLIRGLSCQEHYRAYPSASPDQQLDCSLIDIEARTSTIFSYMLSINSLFSCLSALSLAPWLLRRLGRRGTMLIAVLTPALELIVIASIPNRFSPSPPSANSAWLESSPTTSLRMLLAETLVFGIIGCPDALLDIVSAAIVLDNVPVDLRSTWLARLKSTRFLGMLMATITLQALSVDIRSDMVADKRPILIGASISFLAPLWSLLTLAAQPVPVPHPQQRVAEELMETGEGSGLGTRLKQALKPLRLLWPTNATTQPKRDWRLVKLLIAATLCSQISLSTNTALIYLQFRFKLHARDLSLALGLVGCVNWVFLVLIFPRLARLARSTYGDSALADRLLAILSLLLDVLSWVVVIVGGKFYSLSAISVAAFIYVFAAGNASLITSLASLMLPRGVSVDEMMAALTSMANVMSTIGPILNTNVYQLGLNAGFSELVFALTAFVSLVAATLVASTSVAITSIQEQSG